MAPCPHPMIVNTAMPHTLDAMRCAPARRGSWIGARAVGLIGFVVFVGMQGLGVPAASANTAATNTTASAQTGTHTQTVHRCPAPDASGGTLYSQQPCAQGDGRLLPAVAPPTDAQRQQAQARRAQDMRQVRTLDQQATRHAHARSAQPTSLTGPVKQVSVGAPRVGQPAPGQPWKPAARFRAKVVKPPREGAAGSASGNVATRDTLGR